MSAAQQERKRPPPENPTELVETLASSLYAPGSDRDKFVQQSVDIVGGHGLWETSRRNSQRLLGMVGCMLAILVVCGLCLAVCVLIRHHVDIAIERLDTVLERLDAMERSRVLCDPSL